MVTTMRILSGVTVIALLAGCQSPRGFKASDIKPSEFIQGLINPRAETPSAKATASTNPAPIPAPALAPVPALPPVETVVLSPEYIASEPVFVTDGTAPVYVDSSDVLATDVYAYDQPAPALSYQETSTVTFIESADTSAPAYIEQSAIAYIEEAAAPLTDLQPVAALQTETNFVAADPIAGSLPALPAAEQTALITELPAQPAFVGEPSEALAIEVEIPTGLDTIAPPPVIEVSALPSVEIEEAPLDAPVLPSTEILESELAPLASEVNAPPRPTFTPIPQPGLSNYGAAF